MTDVLVIAVAVLTGLFSSARLTRLITQDHYPPIVWLRTKWDEFTDDGPWALLVHCHWCMAMWVTIPIGLWGYLSDLHISWWFFNVWLAASYIAAMIVERDEVE